ncbi:MAG: AraC family transcriptional regulator [Betaproteobacteria bacterium]
MRTTASNPEPTTAAVALEPADYSDYQPENVRVSSRGLGWVALNFERRESPPGSRDLPQGSRQHLVLVAQTPSRVVRESDGERVDLDLSPGSVVFVPARTSVRWTWNTRISFSALILEPDFLTNVAQSVFGLAANQFQLSIAERNVDTSINNIAAALSREAMRGEAGGRLYAESLANILSVQLLRHYAHCPDGRELEACAVPGGIDSEVVRAAGTTARSALQPRAVAQAVQFMHENYAKDLSLNDIASAVHLSPFHLARMFKQTLGVAPHQHLIEIRVNSARALLSAGSGKRSLAEIAAAVGFSDQSHLTRHFKRLTGVTPSHFRR